MGVHFEKFHINISPTYQSMYPPAHALALAIGQKLTGVPWVGALLSTAAMCGAIYWMLLGWQPPGWAWLGGAFAVLRYGIFSYWVNSCFDGSVTALGGALLLGALPRLRRGPRTSTALIFVLGLLILANSRPLEGYIRGVTTASQDGAFHRYKGDYVFSTMPVQELIRSLDNVVPAKIKEVSDGLMYRDFMTVGLLLNDLKIKDETKDGETLVKDNWIYIQEPDVLAGRLQIFNNWSPAMVSDPEKVWIGVEYFCNEGDGLWTRTDEQMKKLAVEESALSKSALCSIPPCCECRKLIALTLAPTHVSMKSAHISTSSKTCSCSAVTECTVTITRTTPC